ncbi:uncharacterized protein [Nothobranchius furzeri]|uniref:uncharacterized protein n=1 Tax=Nothobranchius furzeri TaxID=105023 RepID=UPI003904C54E
MPALLSAIDTLPWEGNTRNPQAFLPAALSFTVITLPGPRRQSDSQKASPVSLVVWPGQHTPPAARTSKERTKRTMKTLLLRTSRRRKRRTQKQHAVEQERRR